MSFLEKMGKVASNICPATALIGKVAEKCKENPKLAASIFGGVFGAAGFAAKEIHDKVVEKTNQPVVEDTPKDSSTHVDKKMEGSIFD